MTTIDLTSIDFLSPWNRTTLQQLLDGLSGDLNRIAAAPGRLATAIPGIRDGITDVHPADLNYLCGIVDMMAIAAQFDQNPCAAGLLTLANQLAGLQRAAAKAEPNARALAFAELVTAFLSDEIGDADEDEQPGLAAAIDKIRERFGS